jgi:hypothetical protein
MIIATLAALVRSKFTGTTEQAKVTAAQSRYPSQYTHSAGFV